MPLSSESIALDNVEVTPAALHQQPILDNLIQLYAHDFSDFHEIELGPDARFAYETLPLYWIEADRYPFLITVGGKWAGFVLVKKESGVGRRPIWDMAEFFIVRGYRRRRIGTGVAHDIWRRFPGPWEVRVMESNTSALRFWEHTVSAFVAERIEPVRLEKTGHYWIVFSFESPASAGPR